MVARWTGPEVKIWPRIAFSSPYSRDVLSLYCPAIREEGEITAVFVSGHRRGYRTWGLPQDGPQVKDMATNLSLITLFCRD